MSRTLLNLATLRSLRATPSATQASTAGPSRRQVLGMAGAAAVGASPGVHLARAAAGAPFLVQSSRGRIAFVLEGVERWVIDVRAFSGRPRLQVERSATRIQCTLAGAFFPGTRLPADLTCAIQQGLTGWRMDLRLAFGGFQASVPFERWLAGTVGARAAVQFTPTILALGGGMALEVRGRAMADYTPEWRLDLQGTGLAVLQGAGRAGSLTADRLSLTPAAAGSPQLLTSHATRGTVITMARGTRNWPVVPDFPVTGHWRLDTPANAFSSLRIDLSEGRAGLLPPVLSFAAAATDPPLRFTPHEALRDAAGSPFALSLPHALYVLAAAPAGTSAALLARYGSESVWLHALGVTLEVGERAQIPPFELRRAAGGTTVVRATPGILRSTLPLGGAVVEAVGMAEGAYLSFVAPGLEKPDALSAAHLHLDATKPSGPVKVGPITGIVITTPSVSALRPDDMLAVRFEFINLAYQKSADGTVNALVPVHPANPAYLVVHFQGQHIAEQAIFEGVPHYPVPPHPSVPPGQPLPPTDQDRAAGSGNTQFPEGSPFTPVGSRLAGESRLVFALPGGTTSWPFTLEALLRWDEMTQSVAPTAVLPGEHPTSLVVLPTLVQAATAITQRARTLPHNSKPVVPIKALKPVNTHQLQLATYNPLRLKLLGVPPPIAAPTSTQTAIEAPWRLILSPHRYAGWLHSFRPVNHNGRIELWHTRLGLRLPLPAAGGQPARTVLVDGSYVYEPAETPDGASYDVTADIVASGNQVDILGPLRTVRAVWSFDYPKGAALPENNPFRMSLSGQDRHDIVVLSSDFTHQNGVTVAGAHLPGYYPQAIQANRLMLSTLGAWMDTKGDWNGATLGIALDEWIQRGTMAREHFVRVEYQGYLFPFGHKASLVKETERKFFALNGRNVAFLFQHMFIVVREPVKTYGSTNLHDSAGRSIDRWMPLKQITITTKTTPFLDPPQPIDATFMHDFNVQSTDALWARVGGQDFLFNLVGQDGEGQFVEFTAPLAFISVENYIAFKHAAVARLNATYSAARATRPTNGQKVAYAPSSKPGDTTLTAQNLMFGAYVGPDNIAGGLANDQPDFYPIVAGSQASIPQVEAMLHSGQQPTLKLSDHFLISGLGGSANTGEVFAELVSAASVVFGGSNSGGTNTPGVVTPNFNITALSRSLGPVGGAAASVAQGLLDSNFIKDFFSGQSAKILGGIDLFQIILAVVGDFTSIPQFIQQQLPTELDVSLKWNPKLQQFGPFKPTDTDANNKLMVDAEIKVPLTGAAPSFTITGKLNKFEIDLFDVITISFDALTFTTGSGKKLDVKPDNVNVLFAGPLAFINDLKDIIPSGGFSDPPYIDVEPDHVEAGFTLEVPSIGVGIFSIENISLAAKLTLPFFGDPVHFEFDFCTKDHPFLLTVSLLGGGGYFGIILGLDGVEQIEAAFEFGANCSIDLGIASGGISIMAGVYFKLQKGNASATPPTQDSTLLTGFVDAHGSVSVLAIASVSLDFYISLSYEKNGMDTKVWGEATVTLTVSILFFSASFSVSVEKEFAGSHHDPTFADQVSRQNWNDYLLAFA